MTVRDWIRNREIEGLATFSYDDVANAFMEQNPQIVRNSLYRACKAGRIVQVFRSFYVIIPPHYAAKSFVPPVYYIDQLMRYLQKPYYISLLSASEMLGAAHQRPQYFSVMTSLPQIHVQKHGILEWTYRASINDNLLQTRNSETGVVKFSGPELTTLDLIQYEQRIGGLTRATTVIAELNEQNNWAGAAENGLIAQATISAVQRLGYILEHVLQNQRQADELYTELKKVTQKLNRFPLSIRKDTEGAELNKRWNILINTSIEIDDL